MKINKKLVASMLFALSVAPVKVAAATWADRAIDFVGEDKAAYIAAASATALVSVPLLFIGLPSAYALSENMRINHPEHYAPESFSGLILFPILATVVPLLVASKVQSYVDAKKQAAEEKEEKAIAVRNYLRR